MGDKYTLPNLEHMVDLIATLVLSSSRTHRTGGNGTHTNVPESTPFSQSPLLLMNPEEQQLATCGPFINKLLKEGLNVPALEALLLHTSYDSEQRSVPPLQIVLHGIDTMDSDALQPYLPLLCRDDLVTGLPAPLEGQPRDGAASQGDRKQYALQARDDRMPADAHWPSQATARRWMLNQHHYWVQDWLLGSGSEGVRQTSRAAHRRAPCGRVRRDLLPATDAKEQQQQAASVGGSEGASGAGGGGEGVVHGLSHPPPEPPANEEEKELEEQRHQMVADACTKSGMYDHLLSLLPYVTDVAKDLGGPTDPLVAGNKQLLPDADLPPIRLAPYFRTLTWCAREWRYAVTPDPSVDGLL